MRVAVLVDGDFFLRRFRALSGKRGGAEMAEELRAYCVKHIDRESGERLYRIFFYDCPPLEKKAHWPISGRAVDFSREENAQFRRDLHRALKDQPDVALRLGHLDGENARWVFRSERTLGKLLSGEVSVSALTDDDFRYHAAQKGVDARIGLDIAAMAHKRQAERIVLISGDSDFVPVAKTARREGIQITLDPMWHPIKLELREHVDAIRTRFPRPDAQK